MLSALQLCYPGQWSLLPKLVLLLELSCSTVFSTKKSKSAHQAKELVFGIKLILNDQWLWHNLFHSLNHDKPGKTIDHFKTKSSSHYKKMLYTLD